MKKLNQNSVAKFIFLITFGNTERDIEKFRENPAKCHFQEFCPVLRFQRLHTFFGPQDFSTPIFYGPFNAQKPLNSITTRLLSSDAIKRQNYWIINQLDFNLGPCTFGNLKQTKNKCKKHKFSTENFGWITITRYCRTQIDWEHDKNKTQLFSDKELCSSNQSNDYFGFTCYLAANIIGIGCSL